MNTHSRQSLAHVTDPLDRGRYQLVHDFKQGTEAMADYLRLAPGTVRNKAHPEGNDDFTVDQAVEAMNLTGDYRLLDAMAQKCDRVVVEREKQQPTGDKGLLEQFLLAEQSMGEFAADIHQALQHQKLTAEDIAGIKQAVQRLATHAEGMATLLDALKDA